jgi:hypothetical protein
MKEKIYTIPVNDAYRSQASCPLCELSKNVEQSALDYYLGPSLMEPDVRVSTNTTGFCGHHLQKLYSREINRLGLGLMLHTHLKDFWSDIGEDLSKAAPAPGFFFKGRDKDYKKNLEVLADKIEKRSDACIICEKIDFTMQRYLDVLLWMFFEDKAFREQFQMKKSHCAHHTAFLLRGAAKYLSQKQTAEFITVLADQQREGTEKLIEDVEWFTLKFDYRNKDKPWGGAKTALPRAISFLSGEGGEDDGKDVVSNSK